MDREEQPFTPQAIDEQIDRLREEAQYGAPSSPQPNAGARLLRDLQQLYQDDERRLEHIWARLVVRSQLHNTDTTHKAPIDLQSYQRQRERQPRLSRSSSSLPASSRHRTRGAVIQRVSPLLSGLVALFMLGSLVLLPLLLGHFDSSVSTIQKQQQESSLQGNLYLSNQQGVVAVDARTGHVRWTYSIPDYSLGEPHSPLLWHGLVFVESQDSVYAIDGTSGILRWSHTFSSQISPFPSTKSLLVLSGNALYVSVVFMEVVKFDALSGHILNTYHPVLNTNIVSIAIANNTLYAFGLSDMCALRLSDGAQIWYRQLNQLQALGIPHVVGNVIYMIATSDVSWPYMDPKSTSYIESFDALSGLDLWQSLPIHGSVTDIALANNAIYAGATNGSISAYDMKTGVRTWSKTLAGMSFSGLAAPQIENGLLYIAAEDPTMAYISTGIIVLQTSDGTLKWQYPASLPEMKHAGHMFMPPTVQHGIVFAYDEQDGQPSSTLYALSEGAVLWHETINN